MKIEISFELSKKKLKLQIINEFILKEMMNEYFFSYKK